MTPATLLTLAQLMAVTTGEADAPPAGWQQIERYRAPVIGTEIDAYRDGTDGSAELGCFAVQPSECGSREHPTSVIVVAVNGMHDLRDFVAALFRRFTGYSERIVNFIAEVDRLHQPATLIVIGHSAGGGIASWAGAQLGLPTVTFNAARTLQARSNDGSRQINVIVCGDPFGDPIGGLYGHPLAGATVWLHADADLHSHRMATIADALQNGGITETC